ncbi:MAG: hypothetical protein ABI251_10015 [Mycobacteriaceae bacterium]
MTSAESPDDTRATRAGLLPEERHGGSDVAEAQAAEILQESHERTEQAT